MDSQFSSIVVKPLSGTLGCEIGEVDLAAELTNAQFSDIRDAFHKYSVIVFRDQDITPEHHMAFARRWGEINVNRFFAQVDGYPMIAEVRKEPDQTEAIGSGWHTDHSYDTKPALGSILVAREVAAFGGEIVGVVFQALEITIKGFLNTAHTLGRHSQTGVSAAAVRGRLPGRN